MTTIIFSRGRGAPGSRAALVAIGLTISAFFSVPACSSSSTTASADGGSDASSPTDAASSSDALLPPADACKTAGGVCAIAGSCSQIMGAISKAANNGGCTLANSEMAECCIPPKPSGVGIDCAGQGGVCAPYSGCEEAAGYYSSDTSCGGGDLVCCVPHMLCGEPSFSCCGSAGVSVPDCNSGVFQCPAHTDQCGMGGDN